ncbi:hypothetical protein PINS_up019050 [Pythium insidiosum]|nr:hypothetical protein PINS_up019050 [Pythium insidiosum]
MEERMPSRALRHEKQQQQRIDYRAALVSLDSSSDSSLDSMLNSLRRSIASTASRRHDTTDAHDHSQGEEEEDDDDDAISANQMREVGVSPMPKLTHAPRPKPSLLRMPTAITRKPPPPRLQPQAPINRGATRKQDAADSSGDSDSLSLASSIEPPDTLTPQRHASIDDAIEDDLHELHRLVASTTSISNARRSQTTEQITDAIREHTRFGRADEGAGDGRPSVSLSPFPLLNSPSRRRPTRNTQLELQLSSRNSHTRASVFDDDVETFTEELYRLRASLLKEKQDEEQAKEKKKKQEEEEEEKKKKEEPGADLASMRDAVDAIDKSLLLAMRPFEKMREALDKEEAEKVAAEEKALGPTELPMATQAIVDRLEEAFGSMTREREEELKAAADAAAAAKAEEEAKKKEEAAAKEAVEREEKQREQEILSLLPLRGRLMTDTVDIDEALLRMEYAEAQARADSRLQVRDTIEGNLLQLREATIQRMMAIEQQLLNPAKGPAIVPLVPRAINWDRETFATNEATGPENEADGNNNCLEEPLPSTETFGDIVQQEVVEKLELTILKLKHVLGVDRKESKEAEDARRKEDEAKRKKEKEQQAEEERKRKAEADAAAAMQRVMGISSLDELAWLQEEDRRLREGLKNERHLERLQQGLLAESDVAQMSIPSFFDNARALDRFDRMRGMMERGTRDLRAPSKAVHATRDTTRERDRTAVKRELPQGEFRRPRNDMVVNEDDNQYESSSGSSVEADSVHSRHGRRHERRRPSRVAPKSKPRIPSSPGDSSWTTRAWDSASASTHAAPSDKLQQMMHVIQSLQADRREKATWFRRTNHLQ